MIRKDVKKKIKQKKNKQYNKVRKGTIIIKKETKEKKER